VGQLSSAGAQYAQIASAALKAGSVASKQILEGGKITSWTSLAAAAIGQYASVGQGIAAGAASYATKIGDTAGINTALETARGLQTLTTVTNYATPWVQLAETYVRNDGKLKPLDWANAAGSTLATAVTDNFGVKGGGISGQLTNAGLRLGTNLLVAGVLSRYDREAAQSYAENAIGQEVGQFIGDYVGKRVEALLPPRASVGLVFDPDRNTFVDENGRAYNEAIGAFVDGRGNPVVFVRSQAERNEIDGLSAAQRALYDSVRAYSSHAEAMRLARTLSASESADDFVPPDPLGAGRSSQMRYEPLAASGATQLVERPDFRARPYEGDSLTGHQQSYNDLLGLREETDILRRHLIGDEELARRIYEDAIAGNQNLVLTRARLNARDVQGLSFEEFSARLNQQLYQTSINIDDLAVRTRGLIDQYGARLQDVLPRHPFTQAILTRVDLDSLGQSSIAGTVASILVPPVGFLQAMALGRDQLFAQTYRDIGLISPDDYDRINGQAGFGKWLALAGVVAGGAIAAGARYARIAAGTAAVTLAKLGSVGLAQSLARFSRIPGFVGDVGEVIAQRAALARGETVIQTQFTRGAAEVGFDFVSITGSGQGAQLFINEVKNVLGNVSNVSALGLSRSGRITESTLARNIAVAEERILEAARLGRITDETASVVLNQLKTEGAVVRIIGNSQTTMSSSTFTALYQATRNRYAIQLGPRF
jgi:hypothetical protein